MKDELASHWKKKNDTRSMPLPDYIFTSGQIGYDYMSSAGYPEDNLFVCGGIRYYDLRKNIHLMPSKSQLMIKHSIPSQKQIIFVVTTPITSETVAMLRLLYQAIDKQNQDPDKY